MTTVTRRKNTHKPARRKATEAQIAAAKARDAELTERTNTALAAPDVGQTVVNHAATVSERILRYSLKNQVLLYMQAAERGIELTDVAGYGKWQELGRQVRAGEQGLAIICPRGNDKKDEDDEDEDDEGGKDDRPRFRFGKVFDISQTKPADDGEDSDPAPAPDNPSALLYATLRGDAERAGYLVTQWDDDPTAASSVELDAEAATIHIHGDGPETLAAFTQAVADVVTARAAERRKR